ncbi:MAG: type IV pilus assembly protein PilM [Desulfobacter sp.]|nr:MAG: type IV pilus assembly protein PilM [Desulfobacter sp.]
MVLGKKDHLVGLDIGSAFVKVAELKISKKGNSLKKFGMAPVPEGVITEGRISNMDVLAEIIRTLFKSQKIKEKKVAISTGGHSVVIKTISTPTATEKQLGQTIRAEAEQYIPYDIDDVNIDYQILGESEYSPDQMNVLLVAVKKDLVAEYMELTRMAGLVPSIIDVDTFALQNIFETLPDQDSSLVTLLADVGASKTSLNIVKDNSSMMMRDMMTGGSQIVEAVRDSLEIDYATAAAVVQGEAEPPGDPAVVEEICASITNGWCAEICEVVHTFESGTNELRLEQVVLSGGGGFMDNLAQRLRAELNVQVSNIDPFGGLTINSKQFGNLDGYKLQAPIALGLAMRRVDDK